MTLREQLLRELREKDSTAKALIKQYETTISGERFAISTITGGAFAGSARRACERRIQEASTKKNKLLQENKWISEMLDKYK